MSRELTVPFAIDPLGNVAFTSDPVRQITDRVTVLVGTQLHERVMRPTYGVNTAAAVFANNDDAVQAVLEDQIRSAIAAYEPSVTVAQVAFSSRPDGGVLAIRISFTVNSDPNKTQQVAVIGVDGMVGNS